MDAPHEDPRSLLSSTDSCWNPGNSWNSRGINFGTGVCQINYTMLVEWFQDSHRQNGTWNDRNGILDTQIKHWQMLTLNLGIINPSIPSSSTTTTIDNAHPPLHPHHHFLTTITSSPLSHCHHHHQWPPSPTSITHNQHSKIDVAMPRHQLNKCWPHQQYK